MKATLMMVVAVMLFAWQGTAQEIMKDQLPQEITSWIENHFPDQEIEEISMEMENEMRMFVVNTDQDVQMKFTEQGELRFVESEERIPDEVLPESIVNYVNENYQDTYVVKWEMKEDDSHSVELENNTTLEFDSEGNFVSEDEGMW